MEAQLNFRPFHEQNTPELAQMISGLYQDDPSPQGMTTEKILRTIRTLAERPDRGRIVLFWAGDSIAGYSIVIHHWSNEYGGNVEFVDGLYVKPAWRGRGLASAFIDHLSNAEDGSTVGLQLEVTPGNERALQFYLRHGFKQCASRFMFKTSRNPASGATAQETPSGHASNSPFT